MSLPESSSSMSMSSYVGKPRIILIGVGHVFNIGSSIRDVINRVHPQTVALELDNARFYGLMSKEHGRKGDYPLMYQLLAHFQKEMAEEFGTQAGSEMLAAASAANEIGAKLALIDMDAATVFKRLNSSMSLREKVMMAIGAVLSLFARRKTIERELDRYQKDEAKFMEEIQKDYPSIVKALIDDRNKFMSDRLREISGQSPVTVAVVGDGHVNGMTLLLSEFAEVETWRLDALLGALKHGSNSEMTMSFTLSPLHKG